MKRLIVIYIHVCTYYAKVENVRTLIGWLYLALSNIALVFAAQVCRDSEIAEISNAGTPIGQLLLRYPFANHSLDSVVYGVFW